MKTLIPIQAMTPVSTRTDNYGPMAGPRISLLFSVIDLPAGHTVTVSLTEVDPGSKAVRTDAARVSRTYTSSVASAITLPNVLGRTVQVHCEAKDSLGAVVQVPNVSLTLIAEAPVPLQDDEGKQVVVQNPASEGAQTLFVGAAGQPSDVGRVEIAHRFTGPTPPAIETHTVDLQWPFPAQINDFEAHWSPPAGSPGAAWDIEDKMHARFVFPATPVTPNGGGTGNCNVDGGTGFITPAAGNGAFDVDLAAAVPIELKDPAMVAAFGYYDLDKPTGEVTLSTQPGAAKWGLNSVELDLPDSATFVDAIDLGSPRGVFEVNPYKTEYVHPKWVVRITVDKATAGGGTFGGWIMAFKL